MNQVETNREVLFTLTKDPVVLINEIIRLLDTSRGGKLHHNISINYWPSGVDALEVAVQELNDFRENWKAEHEGKGYSSSKEHDEIYQHGRSGATLYWTRYWKVEGGGSGYLKPRFEREDLEEEYNWEENNIDSVKELRLIIKELNEFHVAVDRLMKDFEAQCKYIEKLRTDKKENILNILTKTNKAKEEYNKAIEVYSEELMESYGYTWDEAKELIKKGEL